MTLDLHCIFFMTTLHDLDDNVMDTPPKTNMDTQNDGLDMVTPVKHGRFWYLC